uniref:Retrotransposon gag domain-containing protein n=1 Tax=Heliothis virescens TaxID=7102 RepID=A0A2A4J1N2_HELVI
MTEESWITRLRHGAGGVESEPGTAAFFIDGIPKFSGDDKTISSAKWAQDLEDNAEIFKWSAQQKLIIARRTLVGTAALWLRGEKAFKTYDELKVAVQKEFPETVNVKEMHEIMAARKKQKGETYYQYMLFMKELGRRAKFPDYVAVQYIIDGIQDYESNKAILYGATTYPMLKEKLLLYEKMKSKSHKSTEGCKHQQISSSDINDYVGQAVTVFQRSINQWWRCSRPVGKAEVKCQHGGMSRHLAR